MADLERTYNIPIRKGVMKVPRYKRANKAVRVVREFLQRHMKSDIVKLGPGLNSKIVERGRKNVPHHIEVKTVKGKDNVVRAELASIKNESFLKPEKEEEEKVKIKIPGMGKKKAEEVEKEKVLEKPVEEKKEIPETKIPLEEKKKEVGVLKKEEKVYGREDKKPKVKERERKTKNK